MPRRAFPPPVPVSRPHGRCDVLAQKDDGSEREKAPLGPLVGSVRVPVGEEDEVIVEIHPDFGPLVFKMDGSLDIMPIPFMTGLHCYALPRKTWTAMGVTEQEIYVRLAAKRNYTQCDPYGHRWWQPPAPAAALPDVPVVKEETAREKEEKKSREAQQERARRDERCKREMAREPVFFYPVSMENVSKFHMKRSPGMIYGLEFPWSWELLVDFGPKWLTQAFRAAGTLDQDNSVVRIVLQNTIRVTGGNNGGKFMFEVVYQELRPGLHTQLFAKVPFPFGGNTKSDRLSSSVYKQGMDLAEINAYRLLETSFPMKTPKYYFGDISNVTTNFILITERIQFAEAGGKWKNRPLKPFEIEGPYEKCKDFQLRGPAKDYYTLLFHQSGRIAGLCKSGRMGGPAVIAANFLNPRADPTDLSAWGVNPLAATGEDPLILKRKLQSAVEFMHLAKVVFPEYVKDEKFCEKFTATLMKASAYKNEIDHWKHSDPDYVSLGHQNLNSDNAYFWRDADGKLDCGLLDWGGFGTSCLGHKLWWIVNCANFDQVSVNLTTYMDAFIAAYEENGGPRLSRSVLEMQILLTSLDNTLFMVAAVPNCHKMCPLKEWATIKDRHDKRIAGDIDGKSTLRTTLHVLAHGCRVIHEMGGDAVIDKWIKDCWVKNYSMAEKTEAMINGL